MLQTQRLLSALEMATPAVATPLVMPSLAPPPPASAQELLAQLLATPARSTGAVPAAVDMVLPFGLGKRRASECTSDGHSVTSDCTEAVEESPSPPARKKAKQVCSVEGCTKRTKTNGLCSGHGGGRRCSEDGCERHVCRNGLCRLHGGAKACTHKGCDRPAKSHGLCSAHGGGPRCSVAGCVKHVVGQRLCRLHGGQSSTPKRRTCGHPGCTKTSKTGGFCCSHGGGRRCLVAGCGKHVVTKGCCARHAKAI